MYPQSLESLLRHPEDNRNQIRELAQTLMDGGVLDELIQQKLEAFNTRWDELMARVGRSLLVSVEMQAEFFFLPCTVSVLFSPKPINIKICLILCQIWHKLELDQ